MLDGLCRGLDPNLFIPPFNPRRREGPSPQAMAVCNGNADHPVCPVKKQCFDYGVEHKCSGCWGGVALHLGRRPRKRK